MAAKARVLVVDDEPVVRESLDRWLRGGGYGVETAGSGGEALQALAERDFDLLLIDVKMPGMDGLELFERVREADPAVLVVMMTAFATVDHAVKSLRLGAWDFVKKPFDPGDLLRIVKRALEHRGLLAENRWLRRSLEEVSRYGDVVGRSPAILRTMERVRTAASTDSTVLVRGEPGTGKELVARAVHAASDRRYLPIVPVSCGAFPDTLMESELFGHEEGAFAGARFRRKGKVELADGGALFLDEVAEIAPKIQADLLRVLEERRVTRLGGSSSVEVDFRLISATHRDLEEMIREGAFRRDLYDRLNVVTIPIPPLRERREDIPLLVDHFLGKLSVQMSRRFEGVDPGAMDLLSAYAWPGNVRELENAIERAMVAGEPPRIRAEDLPLPRSGEPFPALPDGDTSLAAMERVHVRRILEKNGGNVSRSARELGIDRATLYNKIRKYELRR